MLLANRSMVEFSHPPYSPDCASQLSSILKCENGLPRGRRFRDIKKTTTELNAFLWTSLVSSVQLSERHEKCVTVKKSDHSNGKWKIFLFVYVCHYRPRPGTLLFDFVAMYDCVQANASNLEFQINLESIPPPPQKKLKEGGLTMRPGICSTNSL